MRQAFCSPSQSTSSPTTRWFSGAPRSRQSGNSSAIERGSITAPDMMCAPGSEPFSSTTTEISLPSKAASCFRRIAQAQARRAGADHHHVVVHRFARAVLGEDFLGRHGRVGSGDAR